MNLTRVWVLTEDNPDGPGVLGLEVYADEKSAQEHSNDIAALHGQDYVDDYVIITEHPIRKKARSR